MSYTHREVFSVMYIIAAFWPTIYGKRFLQENAVLLGTWVVACFMMSAFTLLPVVLVENITLMYVSFSLESFDNADKIRF